MKLVSHPPLKVFSVLLGNFEKKLSAAGKAVIEYKNTIFNCFPLRRCAKKHKINTTLTGGRQVNCTNVESDKARKRLPVFRARQ